MRCDGNASARENTARKRSAARNNVDQRRNFHRRKQTSLLHTSMFMSETNSALRAFSGPKGSILVEMIHGTAECASRDR